VRHQHQAVEIHQLLERGAEAFGVVEAGGLDFPPAAARRHGRAAKNPLAPFASAMVALIWLRKFCARHRLSRVEIASPRKGQAGPRSLGSKLAQPIDAGIRRIAGNDGPFDRPDPRCQRSVGMDAASESAS